MSYENSPWAKKPLPNEFSFTSRDWLKDDVPDSIDSTITVKKIESNIYSLTFDIHSNKVNDGTYRVQDMHYFSYAIVGRLVHQLGFNKYILGIEKSAEHKEFTNKQVLFVGMIGTTEKADKDRISTYHKVNFDSGVLDLVPASDLNISPVIKPEYLW